MTLQHRHDTFQDLHRAGCFLLPNPWDAGSARMLAAYGAQALATSSAAHAFTLGRADMGGVTRDEALAHAQTILAATPLPVSGDFENGFGDEPQDVAETVRLAGEIGLSGCGIEDTQMIAGNPPYPFDLAVERIKAAVSAAQGLGRPFVLTARADGLLTGHYDLAEGIRRLRAFDAAGATCLYLPLPPGPDEIRQIVAAVSAPVNVLAAGPVRRMSVADLAALGVRRISTGSQIARVAHAALRDVAEGLLGAGDLACLKPAAPGEQIDALLTKGAAHGPDDSA